MKYLLAAGIGLIAFVFIQWYAWLIFEPLITENRKGILCGIMITEFIVGVVCIYVWMANEDE